jgi:hypothetical protein
MLERCLGKVTCVVKHHELVRVKPGVEVEVSLISIYFRVPCKNLNFFDKWL